jgi:hypothetical protein
MAKEWGESREEGEDRKQKPSEVDRTWQRTCWIRMKYIDFISSEMGNHWIILNGKLTLTEYSKTAVFVDLLHTVLTKCNTFKHTYNQKEVSLLL